MKNEKFASGYRLLLLAGSAIFVLLLIAYMQRGFPLNQNTFILFTASLIMMVFIWKTQESIYLEVTKENTLINSGYYDFKKDIVNIWDIKYIYRIPQFAISWFGGSLMIIYVRDQAGHLRHTAVREIAYPEKVMKRFLMRIKQIKPTIEFDREYEEFLRDERTLRKASRNHAGSIEERLRAKGEKWENESLLKRFLRK